MTIHREGYKTITIAFLFVAAVLLALNDILVDQTWFHYTMYGLGIWFFIMIVRFFRSPKREANAGEKVILCPADGKIVVIERTIEPEYFKDERIQVSIFMSATNVHVNWFPVGGEIVYYYYHPGKHMVAFNHGLFGGWFFRYSFLYCCFFSSWFFGGGAFCFGICRSHFRSL